MSIRIGEDLISLMSDTTPSSVNGNLYYDKTNKKLISQIADFKVNDTTRLIPKSKGYSFTDNMYLRVRASGGYAYWNSSYSDSTAQTEGSTFTFTRNVRLSKNLYLLEGTMKPTSVIGTASGPVRVDYLSKIYGQSFTSTVTSNSYAFGIGSIHRQAYPYSYLGSIYVVMESNKPAIYVYSPTSFLATTYNFHMFINFSYDTVSTPKTF